MTDFVGPEVRKDDYKQWHSQNISLGGAHLPNHEKEINKIMHKNNTGLQKKKTFQLHEICLLNYMF